MELLATADALVKLDGTTDLGPTVETVFLASVDDGTLPAAVVTSFWSVCLSRKSKQVHRPLFIGSVVSILTILNLLRISSGP